MLILFVLTALDSLPPVPDPAHLPFTEPATRFDLDRDFISTDGYLGANYGAGISCACSGFGLDASFAHDDTWTPGSNGRIIAAGALPLKYLWLRPSFLGCWDKRIDDYRRLGGDLDATFVLPWFVIMTNIGYDRWDLPDTYSETEGKVALYFDRLKVIPQVELATLGQAGAWSPSGTFGLHWDRFHFSLSSPLRSGFPSPRLDIRYSIARMNIELGLHRGTLIEPLALYYDGDKPYRYSVPLPREKLEAGVEMKGYLKFDSLRFGGEAGAFSWRDRLVPDDNYLLNLTNRVDEYRAGFYASGLVNVGRLQFHDVFYVRYERATKIIPFAPKYELLDTLTVEDGPVYAIFEIQYLPARNGIRRVLPRALIVNTKLGYRFRSFRIFCAVFNLGDYHSEIYDGYDLGPQRLAGGLGLDF
jgi:hypothetical protein